MNKNSEFWQQVTLIAEKANKIETIDARLGPCNYDGPATSLNTRTRTP